MYIVLPNIYTILCLTITLAISAYLDMKTKEISLEILAAGFMMAFGTKIFMNETNFQDSLIGLLIGAVPFFALALMNKGGGGDALVMAALGCCIGGQGILYVMIFSLAAYIIYSTILIIKNRSDEENELKDIMKSQFPYIPAVFIGCVIYVGLGFIF